MTRASYEVVVLIIHLEVLNILAEKDFQRGLLQLFLDILFLVAFIRKYWLPCHCMTSTDCNGIKFNACNILATMANGKVFPYTLR